MKKVVKGIKNCIFFLLCILIVILAIITFIIKKYLLFRPLKWKYLWRRLKTLLTLIDIE